ncbi:hypothetical protein COCCU_05505 [Corynebacterium occultum]|uniref:Right handed beta helix domain-containing protein n=1 Tax=Corynebacterium occultum TaxID=2675219 RepID=A0A6B8W529_9CORY|nr:right-handed parallel beta-helix repeat-containing protein [Corynebacterium occultum]QGU07047.1 hypothetical protein COCCU_05505 [Corynebacterium occultum]
MSLFTALPRRSALLLSAAALAFTTGMPLASAQTTLSVNCDAGDSLATAVNAATPNTTINLSGTCEEAIHIPRTTNGLTINGGGEATVVEPAHDAPPTGPGSFTFFIEGQGVNLTGLNISGGAHAVHLSGPAFATITDNTITDSGGAIHLDKDSTGQIAGNAISGNHGYGINLQENSYARIGFTAPTRGLNGNTITDNEGPGIVVKQWSTGWISGNTISGNQGHGVWIDRNSLGEVYDNTIENNTLDGINISQGSGLSLNPEGKEAPSSVAGNRTVAGSHNGGWGIRCSVGGFVSGEPDTLNGEQGPAEITQGCEDNRSGQTPTKPQELSSRIQLSS